MFNLFQVIQAAKASPNPMQYLESQFGGDPNMQQALRMAQACQSPDGIKQTIRNVAQVRGVNVSLINQIINPFGMKL